MKFENDSHKIEIHVKGGFSERKGIKHFSDVIQINDLNIRTRNRIYNIIKEIFDELDYDYTYEINLRTFFVEYIYKDLFSMSDRDLPGHAGNYAWDVIFNNIYAIIKDYDYIEVFTFIEGIVNCFQKMDQLTYSNYQYKKRFIDLISLIFKQENVNYRIIDGKITDIIDENQISSIEETLQNKYNTVTSHYSKSIELLYNVKDYDNSIKESISTVEAMCQVITGNDKATLGDALKLLKYDIHPAMKSAFEKLYGYTSDANGIRHANGLGEGNSTFEEAKYMLISCSAFVNYLKENFENKED